MLPLSAKNAILKFLKLGLNNANIITSTYMKANKAVRKIVSDNTSFLKKKS